jgi:hypothetical protein
MTLGEPDQRGDPREDGVAGQLLQSIAAAIDELAQLEQILGRVPAQRQLGKDDELRSLLGGLGRAFHDARRVPRQVPDRGVDLSQRDPHAAVG